MKTAHKKVLLIIPSKIIARGIESVLSELGEFRVEGILSDISHASEARLRNMDADVIIIDPAVYDYMSRMSGRARLAEYSGAAVVALRTIPMDDEQVKLYDGTISMYDDPVTIVRKLRESLASHEETPESEGHDLSQREKEILIPQRVGGWCKPTAMNPRDLSLPSRKSESRFFRSVGAFRYCCVNA